MSTQNFNNHTRYVPLYHFGIYGAILILLIGSIVNLIYSSADNVYSASLLVAVSVILIGITFYTRYFALRVQDRAIRAEENLRHFILTGKPLSNNLRLSQIISLRFASDEEFVELAKKAAYENTRSKEIKAAIKNWKVDNHRV